MRRRYRKQLARAGGEDRRDDLVEQADRLLAIPGIDDRVAAAYVLNILRVETQIRANFTGPDMAMYDPLLAAQQLERFLPGRIDRIVNNARYWTPERLREEIGA